MVAGQTLQGVPDIGLLLLTSRDGRPVYVKDVADVVVGSSEVDQRAWTMTRGAAGELERRPAVSLAVAKRKGENAVRVAEDVMKRLETIKGRIVPAGLEVTVTRNYGETANEKANELLFHLALATVSIVILITATIGWREGVVVLIVIPTTILLTLFASWMMGYTINRVSLFALIFSIGILVDDAIVVVENIVRHWSMRGSRGLVETAVEAVAEVGNPTIVATLAIVAALLPMMFVSGLMGPYMSPIPANASIAMLFSFFIAVTVTPWLLMRLAAKHFEKAEHGEGHGHDIGAMGRFYVRIATPLLKGRARSKIFLISVGLATLAVCALFVTKDVVVKLLPFDNKSEIQVIVDLPRGSSLEETDRVLKAAADRLKDLPELTSIQAYAGTAAPFNFNGLVRHYYLRSEPQMGDLSVNLTPKGERSRASHAIALEIRKRLADVPLPPHGSIKVVEVPPGPPVLSTLLAEVYGPDAASRRAMASKVRQAFESVDFVVDVDDSFGAPSERQRFSIDQEALEFHGVAGAGGLRHDRRPRGRDGGRLLATRKRPEADRDQGGAAAQRPDARRARAVDAASGRRHGAPGRQRRTRRRRHAQARSLVVPDLSPQRTLRRNGDGRTGGAVRGAGLRHARGRRQDREHGLGRLGQAADRACTASRSTSRSRRCCGTASGR